MFTGYADNPEEPKDSNGLEALKNLRIKGRPGVDRQNESGPHDTQVGHVPKVGGSREVKYTPLVLP
jgi:hypothetical protein